MLLYCSSLAKPLTHSTPYKPCAICLAQRNLDCIPEDTSPTCQTPSNGSICPLKLAHGSQLAAQRSSVQSSFPQTVSDSLCRTSLVVQTNGRSSCWAILGVKMLDKEVLGWRGSTWSAVERADGSTGNVSFGDVTGISSGWHSCPSVSFIVGNLSYTCAIVTLSNQHPHPATLWGGL